MKFKFIQAKYASQCDKTIINKTIIKSRIIFFTLVSFTILIYFICTILTINLKQ